MHDVECLNRNQISAYLSGELSEKEADGVSCHLAECPSCEAMAVELESVDDRLVQSLRQAAPGVEAEFIQEAECAHALVQAQALGWEQNVSGAEEFQHSAATLAAGTVH